MELKIKSTRIIKEDTRKDGTPYKWISVMADDGSEKGTEYTTFDAGVLKIGAGSVIDIGEPDIKAGKLSFKKVVKVISEASGPAPSPNGKEPGGYKRDIEGIRYEYELKAWMQQVDRVSIEAQTVYNRVMEIIPHYAEIKLQPDSANILNQLIEKSLKWGLARFDEKPAQAKAPAGKPVDKSVAKSGEKPPVTQAGKEVDPGAPFPHVGALLKHWSDKGVTREKFMEIVRVKDADLAKLDISAAHQVMLDWEKEHPHDPNDPDGIFR